MKQVAEQLLDTMRTALAAKQAGEPGNHQGILNQIRSIFDTAIKSASASNVELRPMIVEAQRIQAEGARISGAIATTTDRRPSMRGNRLDMKAAFEFQKKKQEGKSSAVEAKPAKVEKAAPPPRPEPEPEPIVSGDTSLLTELAAMTNKKITEHFGSIEAVAAFARELAQVERLEDETDIKFLNRVRGAIKNLADV
jgi:hypothetical protein